MRFLSHCRISAAEGHNGDLSELKTHNRRNRLGGARVRAQKNVNVTERTLSKREEREQEYFTVHSSPDKRVSHVEEH